MTRKEINEIKSQFNIEDCGIQRLCGCYVDGEKIKLLHLMIHFKSARRRTS